MLKLYIYICIERRKNLKACNICCLAMIIGFSQSISEGDPRAFFLPLDIYSVRASEIVYRIGIRISERNLNGLTPDLAMTDPPLDQKRLTDAIFGNLEDENNTNSNLFEEHNLQVNSINLAGVSVQIINDARLEETESFTLSIYPAVIHEHEGLEIDPFTSDTVNGPYPEHVIFILNDDG